MSLAPLLSANELSKSFGGNPLFSGITLAVDQSERVALIGPNGSGKSTLLKILAGIEHPDEGEVRRRSGLRCTYVAQEDSFDPELSIAEVLRAALLQSGMDEHSTEGPIEKMCGRCNFRDKDAKISSLSGGWKKRLAIARGLIVEPELLLLDEPTNHLDINSVLWLENLLSRFPAALLFVSHDRYFIQRLAKRVIEINSQYPRGFYSSPGTYGDFLEAREAYLAGLHQTRDSLANRVRREVEWLRQGAKARTTKSKYRSEQAGKLMDDLKSFNLEDRRVSLEFAASNRKSRDLIKLDNISKELGGRKLFKDITFTLSPGIRLGVVGANGSGKTTFLKVLLGQLKPDNGRVVSANNLRVAFFDQARSQLDKTITLKDALCKDGDSVVFNGKQIHVAGWAERFLFSRDQLSLKLSELSGGEQARVLLAKIMLEESDLLMFDEPTNDLDIKTLEILEESFAEYPGAIVLITHDRYLLDRATTHVLGLSENESSFYGDYSQWEDAQNKVPIANSTTKSKNEDKAVVTIEKEKTKLSFNEKRELETIEKDILKAEELVEKLQQDISSEKIASDPIIMKETCEKLSIQQKKVEALYNRWEELEEIKKQVKENKSRISG